MVFHSSAMRLNFKEGVGYLTFPALESYPFVRHAFSTRLGGVSKDEFFSMNLSFHRGDPDENVLENYRRICGAAGFPYEGLTALFGGWEGRIEASAFSGPEIWKAWTAWSPTSRMWCWLPIMPTVFPFTF